MTALHFAALDDNVEGIRLLLRYGAERRLVSERGETALDMARRVGAMNAVALLSGGL